MPEARFFHIANPLTAREVVALVEGVVCKQYANEAPSPNAVIDLDDIMIGCVADIAEKNIENACVYIAHQKFLRGNLDDHSFGVCLLQQSALDDDHLSMLSSRGLVIEVEDAQLSFIKIANHLYRSKEIEAGEDSHPCDASDYLACSIHPTAIIAKDALIGEGSKIGAYAIIGPGVSIGANCTIESHVTITHTSMGAGVHIYTGARIGQAGFGFATTQSHLVRMPQLGGVIIGDRVEIGANSTVDRATLGNTTIGTGTCIDNQVQIAHNVEIGENCVFAAQVGISGSCKIGHNVMLGGKVGMADHLTIGSGARMAGNSATMRNIPENEVWAGSPAQPIKQYMREVATLRKLTSNMKKDQK